MNQSQLDWEALRPHETQSAFYHSTARFNIAAATRRGGKSVLARRRLFRKSLAYSLPYDDPYMIVTCPTFPQVRRVHWEQIKSLYPDSVVADIRESDMSITLINGVRVQLLGMDKPERAEGMSIDHALIDEVADMKPRAWALSIRPSLSTDGRPGSADFIGKPRGKGFYYDLFQRARTRQDWAAFSWDCYGILPDEEIAQAKEDLDELEFAQEYLAQWVTFEGKCYFAFDEELHCHPLEYVPEDDLVFTLDFNVQPGTGAVMQEQSIGKRGYSMPLIFRDRFTAVIGEVYIPNNSNTRLVCRRFLESWGQHPGRLLVYGDATGGQRRTSALDGSDWDIVESELRPVFGDRLEIRVGRSNPSERARVNAMNARILSADDRCRFAVDGDTAPNIVKDLVNVQRLADGRIDKGADPLATHLTDGIGYYVHEEFPTTEQVTTEDSL